MNPPRKQSQLLRQSNIDQNCEVNISSKTMNWPKLAKWVAHPCAWSCRIPEDIRVVAEFGASKCWLTCSTAKPNNTCYNYDPIALTGYNLICNVKWWLQKQRRQTACAQEKNSDKWCSFTIRRYYRILMTLLCDISVIIRLLLP